MDKEPTSLEIKWAEAEYPPYIPGTMKPEGQKNLSSANLRAEAKIFSL